MKTVYLIAEKSGFFAFGSGCSLTIDAGNLLAMSPSGFGIQLRGFYREEQKAAALLALWGAAIATAPDGALLRWDFDRACVVDELAPNEEVFADPFSADEPVHCPVCGAEMVMDYDGGELVCSSDECDARQAIERAA